MLRYLWTLALYLASQEALRDGRVALAVLQGTTDTRYRELPENKVPEENDEAIGCAPLQVVLRVPHKLSLLLRL